MTTSLCAQQSASFKLEEHAFNNGGHPLDGTAFTASGFAVSLDAIGDTVAGPTLTGASFQSDPGFVAAYPPPREVLNLIFQSDKQTLAWDPERSVGRYNLYRGDLSSLPGTYGSCLQAGISGESAADVTEPVPGQGFFYLVTAENRITEEGTKGFDSTPAERDNSSPCP